MTVTYENSVKIKGMEQGVTKLRLVSTPTGYAVGPGSRCSLGCPTPSDYAPPCVGLSGLPAAWRRRSTFEVSNMSEKKKRGPAPMHPSELRTVRVNVYLHPDEAAELDRRRAQAGLQRGPYMRMAALDKLPRQIPELNRQAWSELSRVGSNLNQLAREFNQGNPPLFDEVEAALSELRAALIGAQIQHGGDDNESED